MQPVAQTKFGIDDGNCIEGCLASIFECPLEGVPDCGGFTHSQACVDFLHLLGYLPVTVSATAEYFSTPRRHRYAIGHELTDHEFLHAVVLEEYADHRWRKVHDPDPRADSKAETTLELVTVFVAR